MRFYFDINKSVAAAGCLLKLHGGRMDAIKLLKLLYWADRTALERWNRAITGDHYVAMREGPVLSIVWDLIKGKGSESFQGLWTQYISKRGNHLIGLKGKSLDLGLLSEREIKLLHEIHKRLSKLKTFDLVDWIHENAPEWSRPPTRNGVKPMDMRSILRNVGKSVEEIEAIEEEAEHEKWVHQVLAG